MEIAKIYDPKSVEDKWYAHWMKYNFFHADKSKDKEPYCITIPPPNVTGVLHMGHMLNNTIQDVLIRKARMEGKNTCWVPGTDHASIATEAKVVQLLRKQGIKKADLGREEFLEHAWEWTRKHGGIILEQLKKLGASCDWERTTFTLDKDYYDAVIRVFVDLYRKGYIYRGLRMINWDCEAKTALSNEEVIYQEDGEISLLYSVKYAIKDSDEFVVIATQRPETIMGDTAIAVHPADDRYKHLIGKKALVPFIHREIPIIADDYVEKDFGTGCLKVTPAHDPNDYEIGQRHNLPVVDTINLDGTLNESCEIPEFVGKDRFEVRDLMVKKLAEAGILVKKEEFTTRIGRSERTNTVVEPKLSLQWFIRMKEISRRAAAAVENDEIKLHPAKFKNTYRHWMDNVKDWCISRQLWWGHRIPAWYLPDGDFIVAENEEEAYAEALKKNPSLKKEDLQQDPDVLDTWASSWIWPIEVFKGFADYNAASGRIDTPNETLRYFYPTNVLVTAPEILFFWVARMIIAGYEYMDEKPFSDVYLTGIVRDKQGRKMSKSLGNSPDPLELMEKYSADGVRVGMLFSSPAGNDLLFDEGLCEQGRNFTNKIWNALRLVKGWEVSDAKTQPQENKIAIEWFHARFNSELEKLEDQYTKFRLSDALMTIYKLVWDDFCAWYLEMVKPEYQQPIDRATYDATIRHFENILKIVHPFMPFLTEEVWHLIGDREEKECILVAAYPKVQAYDANYTSMFPVVQETIMQVRNYRKQKNIPLKEKLHLYLRSSAEDKDSRFDPLIVKLAGLESFETTSDKIDQAYSFMVGRFEFYIPFTETMDVGAEIERLTKEQEYLKGFLESVMKKLGNEKFMANAKPEVVAVEVKKKEDAEAKIAAITAQLATLSKTV